MNQKYPFRYFKTSPEIIRLAVMYYVRFPLSLRRVEDILHERGIDICHETVRYWWNRFGPKWRWHLDKVFVKINGEPFYLWRAIDQEGEVLQACVSERRIRSDLTCFAPHCIEPAHNMELTCQYRTNRTGNALVTFEIFVSGI